MSTGGDNTALNVDDENQIFRDNVEMLKQELDQYSPEQLQAAIPQTLDDKEIAPIDSNPATLNSVTEWTIVQRTERAEALIEWLAANKFNSSLQSPRMSYRRASNMSMGSVSSQEGTNTNL